MDTARPVTRRAALKDMGKAGLAIMVFGTACTGEPGSMPTTSSPATTGTSPSPSTPTTVPESTTAPAASAATEWARVQMAIVSAYILYRGDDAALVDTGQPGSAEDIQAALSSVGLSWDAVGHVILTHRHADHIGSAEAVAALAPDSTFYIGEGDAEAVADLRGGGLELANDGDDIFGLQIVSTPGHTSGHISVLDEAAGVLVAGDAMNRVDGALTGSNPSFTADETAANESILKLAGFDFETILFGHADPILSGGADEVARVSNLSQRLIGAMSTIGEVLVGFVILVSLVGIVLPVLPGLALTVAAILVWALVDATVIGWVVFAICFGLGAAATVIKYLIPGRKLKESGIARSTMLFALFGAVIGFFVIPVIGAPFGFLAGIYFIQWNRMGRNAAWPATLRTAGAIALSIGIELAGGLLIFGVWLVAAIWG